MNLFYKIYLQSFNVISIVLYHRGPTFGQVLYSCKEALVVDASDYSGHLIRHLLNASEAFPTGWFLQILGNKSKDVRTVRRVGKHLPSLLFPKISDTAPDARGRPLMYDRWSLREIWLQFLLPFQGSVLQNTDHVPSQHAHIVLYWSLAHNCRENQNDCIILLTAQAECAELLKWPTYTSFFSPTSRQALQPAQLSILNGTAVLSEGLSGRGVKLTPRFPYTPSWREQGKFLFVLRNEWSKWSQINWFTIHSKKLSDGNEHHRMPWISTRTMHIQSSHFQYKLQQYVVPEITTARFVWITRVPFLRNTGQENTKFATVFRNLHTYSLLHLSSLVFLQSKPSISKSSTSALTSLYFSARCGLFTTLYRIRVHLILRRSVVQWQFSALVLCWCCEWKLCSHKNLHSIRPVLISWSALVGIAHVVSVLWTHSWTPVRTQ